ncbi:hypothetical protein C7G42_28160 [Bradyrhizobium sp. MOS003]|nr:hypothetical protein C7G42_28160 [Bradyrhizobium sp. MOS003]
MLPPTLFPSLRAQRSNPDCLRGKTLDCFVARAPRNDGRGRHFISGIENSAPSLTPDGQREVTVLVLV